MARIILLPEFISIQIITDIMTNIRKPAVQIYLLPRRFRFTGYVLTVIGILLSYIRFGLDLKLRVLNIKVFAFYSVYFEKKYFKVIENNFTEEAAMLFLLIGLMFIAFAKEKIENQLVRNLRLKALVSAVYLNFMATSLAVIFIFGLAFVQFLVLNLFLMIFLFILISKYYFIRYRKEIINYAEGE